MKQAPIQYSRLIAIGLFIASVSLFSGCKNTTREAESETTAPAIAEPEGEEVIRELSGYPIPNSYELTERIYEAGAKYNLHISNGPEKAGDYITQRDKVLNLGVYAADLCYATTYMMKQATLDYLEASKILIDDLGIATTFNIDYAERIENNIDNRDSLIAIVTESFDDTWAYMQENRQDIMARLVVCGSWIEGFYLTTKVAADADNQAIFMEALAKQKSSLTELVDLLDTVKDAEEVKDIYAALTDMQEVFEGVGESLTEEQYQVLSEKIDVLRTSIV
jgi:hypothetical protein